jgi:glycogen(starch) synthase
MNAPIPKRILMSADTVGGVWTYALELSRALEPHGVEVALATMGAPLNRAQRAEALALHNVEVYESAFKLEWMDAPWNDVARAGDWLLDLEEQLQPDVVHLNNFSHGSLPWRAPKVLVGHSCVLSWWRAVKNCDAPADWNIYRIRVTEGLQLADLVISPSQTMLDALSEHYGPFVSTAVIPNGRQIAPTRQRARHEFIFAAGRLWDEAKNISALAKIASRLSWPAYIAGETRDPDGRELRHSHVNYLGHLQSDELQQWLLRAPIYTLPARYEPFGLAILEAALAGCALVLGDIASLRENWNDAALFVPPNDSDALQVALEQLISDPNLLADFSAKARGAAAQFTPEKMAASYLAAYSHVMQKHFTKISNIENRTPNIGVETLREGGVPLPFHFQGSTFEIFHLPPCAS